MTSAAAVGDIRLTIRALQGDHHSQEREKENWTREKHEQNRGKGAKQVPDKSIVTRHALVPNWKKSKGLFWVLKNKTREDTFVCFNDVPLCIFEGCFLGVPF